MYGLLVIALGCVGASIGDIIFTGDRSLTVAFARSLDRCALRFQAGGLSTPNLTLLDRCTSGAYRSEGLFVLAAAVALPILTCVLVLVVPWLDRRRLARDQRPPNVPDPDARFGSLCDEARLTGRRRPSVVVAGLSLAQAFTTTQPGGRPLVVLPVSVALARDDPARFDPVVLHELAHVRAGDVRAASAVRGIAWITIPAVALASIPGLIAGGSTSIEGTELVQALAFVLATLLLAAAVLRRREVDADRQAARWMGSPEALRSMLDSAGMPPAAGPRELIRAPLRLLSRHPPVRARVAALRDLVGAADGGFPYAVAVGAIAAMAINTSYYIAVNFDESLSGFLPSRVAAGIGGILLGAGLMPALMRRASLARESGIPAAWRQPTAGVAVGLLLGSITPPGTAFGFTLSLLLGEGARGIVMTLLLVLAGAGMTMLAAGLASLAADRFPDHQPAWITTAVTAVMCCCTAVALLPLPALVLGSAERFYLTMSLPEDPWRWLALLYPAAVIALTRPVRLRAVLSSVVTPACAAIAAAVIFFPLSQPPPNASAADIARLGQEQWWIGALTGVAVLIVLAVAGGVPRLARAVVSAWLATVLVALERVIDAAITGGWHEFRLLPLLLVQPSVWLFYLAGPAACLALLRIRPAGVPAARWAIPAVATAGAAAVALSVFGSGIPALLVPVAPAPPSPAAPVAGSGSAQPVVGGSGLVLSAQAGRELTPATAAAIVADAGRVLPAGWASNQPVAGSAARVTVRPTTCLPLLGQHYLSVLPAPVTQARGAYHIVPGFIVGSETLSVQVETFATTIPAALLSSARADLSRCHQYTVTTASGTDRYTAQGAPVPGFGRYAWRANSTIAFRSGRSSLVTLMVSIGSNLVFITQQTVVIGTMPPPDNSAISAVLAAVADGLQSPGAKIPATPASPTAPAVALPVVAGTWTGTYTCRQGVTGLQLVITGTGAGSLTATFSFYPVAGNPGVATGSFAMSGTQSGSAISLRPDHWINRPAGYIMSGLSARLAASEPILSGRLTVPGCTTLSLLRS
jgi:Zn-dependent protease with chaperone function